MPSLDALRAELSDFDGRNPTVLSEISARYKGETGFRSELVALACDKAPITAEGATWILKAQLEEGYILPPQDVERLASRLSDVKTWQAQLHICQSIRYLVVPKQSEPSIETWLKKNLDARRPFLRAWSVDAYCRLFGGSSQKARVLQNNAQLAIVHDQ